MSFAKRMSETKDKWLVENVISSLMASFARLDVPVIMEKARGFWSHQQFLMFPCMLGVPPLQSCLCLPQHLPPSTFAELSSAQYFFTNFGCTVLLRS